MNIHDRSAFRQCTSCQMCAAVCERNAIKIKLNEDGFYRPYVDDDSCSDCGLCIKVCYKFDGNVKVTPTGALDKVEVHSAQLLSDDVLRHVTSGGVADALAKELIKQGYACIGVSYNDDKHQAEHIIASTSAETDAFRGSKYIQSCSYDAFKYLVKNARTTKFAVFGLPCQIYAIHKYLSNRKLRENSILVDLFCHGCPSMLVWDKYEKSIKQMVANKTFDDVQFRSKAKGWGTFHVEVVIDGKRAFLSTPKNDEFYSLFFSDKVLNDACNDCYLRSTMEYTDIRLGDFWGKKFLSDKKGVSAVAITSDRGREVFQKIKEQFVISDSNMKEVMVKQSYGKIYVVEQDIRKRILDSLRDEKQTLKDAVVIFENKESMGYKVKKLIRIIDWYLPFDLIRLLKRFA